MRTSTRLLSAAPLAAALFLMTATSAGAALLPLPLPKADLGVALSDGPGTAQTDRPITYTATVSNAGRDASSSVVTFELSSAARVVQAPDHCSTRTGSRIEVTCFVERLRAGDSTTVSLVATFASAGNQNVTASVEGIIGYDPDRSDNRATIVTAVDWQFPDASKSRAYGPGLEGGVAGERAPFTVELNQANGQRYQGTTAQVTLEVVGPHGPARTDVVAVGNGLFSVSYLPLDPGPYSVDVLVVTADAPAGTRIASSPFSVTIDKNPNEADASKSRAYGPGLEGGNTAEPAIFYVEVNTPSGQRYLNGDPPVGVDITDPSGDVVFVEKSTTEPGVLQFSYSPTEPGTYRVEVIVRNKFNPTFYEHLPGSPFHVPIEAGTNAGD